MRARVFFISIFLLALAIVAYALKPLYVHNNAKGPNYIHTKSGLYIEGKSLNNLIAYDKNKFAVSLAPGTANPQKGPRFISLANGNENDGVKFNMPAALTAELAQKPAYAVVITFQPINTAPAGFVTFSFINEANEVQTFKITNPKGTKISRFYFVGNRKALKQILINPALEGQEHGIEVASILVEN